MSPLYVFLASTFLIVIVYSVIPNILTRILGLFSIRKCAQSGGVALTFDDGPDPAYTNRLLDVLEACHIRATFFVIATKAISHPDIIQRMVTSGHEVQVHGYEHDMVPLLSPRKTRQQVSESMRALSSLGVNTTLYRPTWGLCNLWTLVILHELKHKIVLWSVMVGDWRITESHVLLVRIMHKLHDGAIIVLHDSDETPGAQAGAPEHVISLIPMLHREIQRRGYVWQTLSECLREG